MHRYIAALIFLLFSDGLYASLSVTDVFAEFDASYNPIFRSHIHSLNWWLEHEKPKEFLLVNKTEGEACVEIIIKKDFPHPTWGTLPSQAPGEDGFNFIEVSDVDADGALQMGEVVEKIYFSSHYKGSHKVSIFQVKEVTLAPGARVNLEMKQGYALRGASCSEAGYFLNLSAADGSITLSVSPEERPITTTLRDFILRTNFKDESGKEFYETDENYELMHRAMEFMYSQGGLARDAVKAKRQNWVERAKEAIGNSQSSHPKVTQTIPRLMHRIWYTSDEDPQEIAPKRLKHYLAQVARHPDFQHILWVNSKANLPATMLTIQRTGLPVLVRELREIEDDTRGIGAISRFKDANHIIGIVDIMRLNVICLFGGVYADFGVQFEIPPSLLTDNFTSFSTREGWIMGNTVISCIPQHPVLNKILDYIDNINRAPYFLRDSTKDIGLPFVAMPLQTAMFDLHDVAEINHIAIPWNKGIISTNNTGSWFDKGGFSPDLVFGPLSELPDIRCYAGFEKFIVPFSARMFGNEKHILFHVSKSISRGSMKSYTSSELKEICEISHIHHRCWLTNPHKPHEIPVDRLDMYLRSVKRVKKGGWKHYFWCFDPTKIPETIDAIRHSGLPIEIHTVAEVRPHMRAGHVFDAMIRDSRYTNANDVFRLNLLYLFGGLYSDIGMEFFIDLTDLVDSYSYFVWSHRKTLDTSLFACKKNDPLIDKWLSIIDKLYDLPIEQQLVTVTAAEKFAWTNGDMLMALMFSTFSGSERVLLIEHNSIAKRLNFGSWYSSNPKFGNKGLNESKFDIFDIRTGQEDLTSFTYKLGHECAVEKHTVPMAKHLFGKEREDLVRTRALLVETSQRVQRDASSPDINVIPHIHHRVWLTSPDKPYEVPRDRLEGFFKSVCRIAPSGWTFKFWCMDPHKIPRTIKRIRASGLPIEIHTVGEILEEMKARHVFEAYMKDERYTVASSLVRFNLINMFGGVYSDIGVEYLTDITPMLDKHQYIWFLRPAGVIDEPIIGAPPNDPILTRHLSILDRLYELPKSIQAMAPSHWDQFCWTGSHFLMAVIDSLCTGDEKMFFVPEGNGIAKLNGFYSWGNKPKFGNKGIGTGSSLNIFEVRPESI